jgi:hypothetical protein
MGRNRIDEEEVALLQSVGQGRMWVNEGALQQIQKVLLSCSTLEGLGYVTVNEKAL